MDWIQIMGICSALAVLVAFGANEYRYFSSEDFLYDFLNFIGSVGLFFYAYEA